MQKPQEEAAGRADVSCFGAPLRFLGCAELRVQPSRLPSPAPPTTASDKAGGKSAAFLSPGRGNLSAIWGYTLSPVNLSGLPSRPPH